VDCPNDQTIEHTETSFEDMADYLEETTPLEFMNVVCPDVNLEKFEVWVSEERLDWEDGSPLDMVQYSGTRLSDNDFINRRLKKGNPFTLYFRCVPMWK
jgi:hypothetical protein